MGPLCLLFSHPRYTTTWSSLSLSLSLFSHHLFWESIFHYSIHENTRSFFCLRFSYACPSISHICLADDSIIFYKVDIGQAKANKKVLQNYASISWPWGKLPKNCYAFGVLQYFYNVYSTKKSCFTKVTTDEYQFHR